MNGMMRTVVAVVLLAVGGLVLGAVGEARGGSPPGAGAMDQARVRMEKGQQLFAQGRYAQALAEFEAAYDVAPYGAFLYNAALAAEKARDRERAIVRYKQFLAADPNAPDAAAIRETIARLERELAEAPPVADAGGAPDGGASVDGGLDADAGTDAPPVPADAESIADVRSLVFVESEPPGAPLIIYQRIQPTARPFVAGGDNPGWTKIISDATTPRDLSLKVGHYHLVVEAFQDYKRSETAISLAAGHVYTFKANLSQGEFLGLLEVKSKVEGARIYVDDPPPHKEGPWGRTPHRALVGEGIHKLWVEKAGYQTFTAEVKVSHGKTAAIVADLDRIAHGFLVIDGNADEVDVEIDEQPHGSWVAGQKALRLRLPAGSHLLELDASGRNAFEGIIEVPAGQELKLHGTLTESKGWGQAIGLGVAAAGATVGGYLFWQHAQSRQDDGEDDHDTWRWIGNGFFIGAGVFGAASIFFFIYDPTDDSLLKQGEPKDLKDEETRGAEQGPSVGMTPWLGPGIAGLGVSGVF